MRRVCFMVLILSLIFFVAACSEEEETSSNDDDDNDAAGDDDDTDEPGFTEPWNEDLPTATVRITAPANGAIGNSPQVVVQGTVTGAEGNEVWVNGEAVAVTNGAFQTTLTFVDDERVLTIHAATPPEASVFGADKVTVFRGNMLPADQIITDAFFLALGDEALDVVGALVADLLSDIDFMPVLEGLNPIIDTESLTVEVTAAAIGGADFQGAFLANGFGFSGALTDVVLGLSVAIGALPLDFEMTIGAFNFEGLADVYVADGSAAVTITHFDLGHENVTATGALPAIVIELILGAVEGVVENLVLGTLPDALEDILASLNVQTTLIGYDLELGLTTIDIDAGGMISGFDINAYLTDPPSGQSWPVGSLFTPGDAPDLLGDRPDNAAQFGFGFSFGDDLLNKLLFSVAESGLLELALGGEGTWPDVIPLELSAGTLALIFPSLGSVDPQTPASLVLTPAAVPVALPADDGRLTLRMPDWRMEVYLHPEGEAVWRAMELGLDLTFAVDIDPTAAGALLVSLPALGLESVYLYNPLGDDSPVLGLLTDWLPELLGGLLNAVLGGLPIGLPDIAGIGMDVLYWDTAGDNQDYWTALFGMTYMLPEK